MTVASDGVGNTPVPRTENTRWPNCDRNIPGKLNLHIHTHFIMHVIMLLNRSPIDLFTSTGTLLKKRSYSLLIVLHFYIYTHISERLTSQTTLVDDIHNFVEPLD